MIGDYNMISSRTYSFLSIVSACAALKVSNFDPLDYSVIQKLKSLPSAVLAGGEGETQGRCLSVYQAHLSLLSPFSPTWPQRPARKSPRQRYLSLSFLTHPPYPYLSPIPHWPHTLAALTRQSTVQGVSSHRGPGLGWSRSGIFLLAIGQYVRRQLQSQQQPTTPHF